jgi:hypothetical protein
VRRWLAIVALLLFAWIAWAALTVPPPSARLALPAPAAGDPPMVRGAYHVHSRASDGTGTLPEIAAAAARAGLRFVILTDHGNGFRRPAPPRYLGRVLCIDAVEISTTDGHYVALGMPAAPYPLGGEARDVVEDVARLGGFGIAAHPDSAKRELRWEAWDTDVDGMEWFNADSQWRDEPRWRLLPAVLQYLVRPTESVASLFDRPEGLLRRWDTLSARRPTVGLAAADAHARMGLAGKSDPYDELVYVKAPSYETIFRAFSLRVELLAPLSGDAEADAGAVLAAIRAGRVYSAFDSTAGPAALSFTAKSGGRTARQGEELAFGGPVQFRAVTNAPPGGSLTLIRNGDAVQRAGGSSLVWQDERPGAYRVEASAPGAPGDPPLPWIVSNPIYVGQAAAKAPAPAVPPAAARLIWPAGAWHIEKDPRSTGVETTTVEAGVIRHRLEYALGPGAASPFVALVTLDVGALRDATRLTFRAASTRPMRMSVQVRLVDGASERRWLRSVYLEPRAREITVTFADMRVAGTAARERFAMADVQALLFVVDTVNARPGDGGALWIDGLRTER